MDCSGDEEDEQFFESLEEMVSPSDSGSEAADNETGCRNADARSKYEIWKRAPSSIQERRQRFLVRMGLANPSELGNQVNSTSAESTCSTETANSPNGIERLRENSGAVLRTAGSSGRKTHCKNVINIGLREGSVRSSSSSNGTPDVGEDNGEFGGAIFSRSNTTWECMCKIKNLDSGKEFVVDELGQDGLWNKLREVGTDRQLTMDEFERSLGLSPLVQELMRRESGAAQPDCNGKHHHDAEISSSKRRSWLKALKSAAYSMRRHKEDQSNDDSQRNGRRSGSFDVPWGKPQWTKVHHYRKRYKEFTALYMGQEIEAHEGSIWTMKFSLDGRYLASAGQDRVIHVREVIESMRTFGADTPDLYASSAYFSMNGLQELVPLSIEDHANKMKRGKIIGSKKSSNSDCIVVPNKIFQLSEEPVCSFHGHLLDVFDLSWSPSQYLLSSSMDKTVRLWKLGHESCLKVFSHNDIVTCIQFNPVDERYFISGSLDGKARIWSIRDRHVVDWSDLREMVTAVCYTPDGQGGLVGSIKGSCRFYNTSGNKLQLENQVSVCSKKKKSSGKKITGFQFAPGGDSQKVLITSADSRVRVYDGSELVCKYKGFRNTCSQISASFAPNGQHFICASEDSRVYIWNHESPRGSGARHEKSSWSHEHFLSQGVSVAIPWAGMKLQPPVWNSPEFMLGQRHNFPSLQGGKDVGCQNGLLSREAGEGQESETPLHYASQLSHSCGSQNLIDRDGQDDLSRYSAACISDSRLSSFMAFPESPGNPDDLNSKVFFSDSSSKGSATWPEEKLPPTRKQSRSNSTSSHYDTLKTHLGNTIQGQSGASAAVAWGLVIVTAGRGGEIRSFQNYGLPVRL